MSKLKIVHLLSNESYVPTARHGAVQTVAMQLSAHLASQHETYIVSALGPDQQPYENIDGVQYLRVKTQLDGIWHHINKITLKPTFYEYLLVASIVIKKLAPDILVVHNRPTYISQLRRQLGRYSKIILYEHNHNINDMLSDKRGRRVLDQCDMVIELSEYSKKYDIGTRYPDQLYKACVVNNGVDAQRFVPFWEARSARDDLRTSLGLQGKKVILFSGAIRERKGVHTVVEAMVRVLAQHPDTVLLIAGGSAQNTEAKDKFSKKLYKKAKKHGDAIRFLGFIPHDEMHKYYQAADIYCAPSVWDEPFGLVMLEAMATGLPVVSSKRGGIPEVVADGQTGLLVEDPEHPEELADKLIKLLVNPALCQKMGHKGRERVLKQFTWAETSRKFNKILLIIENKKMNKLKKYDRKVH